MCFTEKPEQPTETNNNEEKTHRIREILKEKYTNREIRNYYSKQRYTNEFIRWGNVRCRGQTANHKPRNCHSLKVV